MKIEKALKYHSGSMGIEVLHLSPSSPRKSLTTSQTLRLERGESLIPQHHADAFAVRRLSIWRNAQKFLEFFAYLQSRAELLGNTAGDSHCEQGLLGRGAIHGKRQTDDESAGAVVFDKLGDFFGSCTGTVVGQHAEWYGEGRFRIA